MQLVDTALKKAAESSSPVRVGIVGAGYSGALVAYHLITAVPGIRVSAIGSRTASKAVSAFERGGVGDVAVGEGSAVETALSKGRRLVTEDIPALCASDYLDVIVDATGTIEFGAEMSFMAVGNRKHLVSMNVELDSTIGPLLNKKALENGVLFSNIDGDEPGTAKNLIRTARGMGLDPVLAGNLKGLYDPYRNPDTQKEFARARGQRPATMTHFADGTKLSMELTVLANGTGFGVGKRGGFGPSLDTVHDAADYFEDKLLEGGMVDFLVGARPANGVFLLGRASEKPTVDYLEYFKMGSGPLYCFYTPFHLPHLEISNTIARVALFGDATIAPLGPPVCDAVAVAKRDLEAGETLDGLGGFCAYGLLENYAESIRGRLLPMGVSKGCRLIRNIPKDAALSYDDVVLPKGRTIDRLREEQLSAFGNRGADTTLTDPHRV